MKSDSRIEVDTFGEIEIPKDKYWGLKPKELLLIFRLVGSYNQSP